MERREKSSSMIILFFFIPFLLWVLLQFISPMAIPQNSINDLTGLTGVSDNQELINGIPGPWNSIYTIGDRLCHQKADRSFFINGNQMPFCARCTAIWLGLAIGLGFMVLYKIPLNEKFILAIIIALIPIGIDGFGQLFNFWESTNVTRVITGSLIGIVCGMAIGFIIDEIRDLFNKRKENKKIH